MPTGYYFHRSCRFSTMKNKNKNTKKLQNSIEKNEESPTYVSVWYHVPTQHCLAPLHKLLNKQRKHSMSKVQSWNSGMLWVSLLFKVLSLLIIHPFILQIFFGHLLCKMHCMGKEVIFLCFKLILWGQSNLSEIAWAIFQTLINVLGNLKDKLCT